MVFKLLVPWLNMKKLLTRNAAKNLPEEDDYWAELKRFSLQELQVATNNFSTSNFIGEGGSGKIYKGLLVDGSLVAIKRMKGENNEAKEYQFRSEVEVSSLVMHPNICCLLGLCITQNERLLVYPFMINGDLASYLRDHSRPLLGWPIRKQVALGVARGLAHLHHHCSCTIIHRNVKALNVLLNHKFEAILTDFGLAKFNRTQDITNKFDTDSPVTTAVRGTIGFIAPEYLSTGKCSSKTDVFAYGIMLLELCTGQRAFDLARLANDDDVMLLDWVKGNLKEKRLDMLVDSNMNGINDMEEVQKLVELALLCTQSSPSLRPKMSEVVAILIKGGSQIHAKESFGPSNTVQDTVWMRLWKAPISECHKLLLWKLMSKTLPVKSMSNERSMTDEMKCKICGSPESLEHLFMECELVKQLWLQSRWAIRMEVFGKISITEWISILLKPETIFNISSIQADELILFAAISFEFIWSFRNQKDSGRIRYQETIINQISKSYRYQSVFLNG